MENIYDDINKLISSELPTQRANEIIALLELDVKLREEFMILLHSREYLIAKSGLSEIERDSDQHNAKELVIKYFDAI